MFSEALFRYTVDHNNGKKFLIYNVKNDRIWIFVYIIFIFYKTHQYFVPDGGSRYIMSYSRFYPYSSIIDKQLDPDRERIYRYYSLEQWKSNNLFSYEYSCNELSVICIFSQYYIEDNIKFDFFSKVIPVSLVS